MTGAASGYVYLCGTSLRLQLRVLGSPIRRWCAGICAIYGWHTIWIFGWVRGGIHSDPADTLQIVSLALVGFLDLTSLLIASSVFNVVSLRRVVSSAARAEAFVVGLLFLVWLGIGIYGRFDESPFVNTFRGGEDSCSSLQDKPSESYLSLPDKHAKLHRRPQEGMLLLQ